jgi:hypothetical protein
VAWRLVDDATAMGHFPERRPEALSRHRLLIGAGNVPKAIKSLLEAAYAEGRRTPVVLGPPAGGEDVAGELSATLQKDGRLEICSLPLLKLINAAAGKLGVPVACMLRAEPQQRRCRLWLVPPGSSLEALEAPVLPAGVSQLNAAALAAEAAHSWAAAGECGIRGALAAINLVGADGANGAMHMPANAVPPALQAAVAAGERARVPLAFGPPIGGEARAGGTKVLLREEGGLRVNSAPLIRLLREAREAAAAAGAPLDVVLRAEPDSGRCRLWLAPSGSEGAALEAPTLPAGVAQISEAALAAHAKAR